jgi:hypothetical protein
MTQDKDYGASLKGSGVDGADVVATGASRECGAPCCPRPAYWLATGIDFDGTAFEDCVCHSCVGYLLEHDGVTATSLATGRDYWQLIGGAR